MRYRPGHLIVADVVEVPRRPVAVAESSGGWAAGFVRNGLDRRGGKARRGGRRGMHRSRRDHRFHWWWRYGTVPRPEPPAALEESWPAWPVRASEPAGARPAHSPPALPEAVSPWSARSWGIARPSRPDRQRHHQDSGHHLPPDDDGATLLPQTRQREFAGIRLAIQPMGGTDSRVSFPCLRHFPQTIGRPQPVKHRGGRRTTPTPFGISPTSSLFSAVHRRNNGRKNRVSRLSTPSF